MGRDPVTHHGKFYTFDNVDALPKPVQARVPIGIAANPWRSPEFSQSEKEQANEERVLRRVARLADSWQTDAIPPVVLRERWERIQEYSAEYGRPGAVTEMSLHLMVNINDDAARARQESVEFLTKYYGENAIADDFLDMWLACGSPAAGGREDRDVRRGRLHDASPALHLARPARPTRTGGS